MRAGAPLLAAAVASLLALAACGEKSQVSERSTRLIDSSAWAASADSVPAYYAPGWKPAGDKTAWEAQINARTKQGQNDYAAR